MVSFISLDDMSSCPQLFFDLILFEINSNSHVTVSEQTIQHYVTQRCQICEQGLYDNHIISES